MAGLKFRRQYPLGSFVLDFYCHEHRLAVELDGDSHIGQAGYDLERQQWIESQGVRVLRVGNDDVLQDMDSVLEGILKECGVALDSNPLTPALSQRERENPRRKP